MGGEIALFGAGKIGKAALSFFRKEGKNVFCFLDNESSKWGSSIMGVPVMGLDAFCELGENCHVLLTCSSKYHGAITKQLHDMGIMNVTVFDTHKLWSGSDRESLVSYSQESDMEDIVLYNVLHDVKEIFYIDVGSNDPWMYSVTKLLYDKGGHGINIDPIEELIALSKRERPRDINICAGVGAENGRKCLYYQGAFGGGLSTVVEENRSELSTVVEIDVLTLKEICRKYIKHGQEIHFLKIDVEGFEKDVLLGSDFSMFRPWIICIESTYPGTDTLCHEKWESIIFAHNYIFATQFGVNRYYVASEHRVLINRFLAREDLLAKYRVFHAELMMY